MTYLLFLCTANSARSQMAEGFAMARAPRGVEVSSAGTRPAEQVHPMAVEVMAEIGIDISRQSPKAFSDALPSKSDIVITLCEQAATESCAILPGHPAQVNWNLPDPAAVKGSDAERLNAFRETRDRISQLVDDLIDRGYLKALAWSSRTSNLMLDSLSEGIIAHDIDRHIIFFNRAAEEITGYGRDEVVGRDCHDVFAGNFCGGKCSFCDETPSFNHSEYPVTFVTKRGETHQLEMSVQSIKDSSEMMLGVLASFRDVTLEKDMARRLGEIESFSGIIGRDKKMLEIFDLIRTVADSNVPILIQGASGTGKELVAVAIHNEGRRSKKLFVPVNCGALPEGLLESELFGHVRGAFTGAVRDKKGRFELADGGTIFLDEIGDISPAMQVKLLRVLQDGTFERVGGTDTIRTDVRIISATNKDIRKEIGAGRFRDDLYYRLCVVPIELPPLCERCGDIPLLVDHIINRITSDRGKRQVSLSPAALDAILSYEWPGNIRELQNALQFAMVKCKGHLIEVADLPPHVISNMTGSSTILENMLLPTSTQRTTSSAQLLRKSRNKLTLESVNASLKRTGGNKAKAARILGVGRATLYRFLDSIK